MGDTDRVFPGMPFEETPLYRATFINDLIEIINQYKRERQGALGGGNQTSIQPPAKVKNSSGTNLVRGNVLQISGRRTGDHDPLAPWFEANTPSVDVDQRIAILIDATPD